MLRGDWHGLWRGLFVCLFPSYFSPQHTTDRRFPGWTIDCSYCDYSSTSSNTRRADLTKALTLCGLAYYGRSTRDSRRHRENIRATIYYPVAPVVKWLPSTIVLILALVLEFDSHRRKISIFVAMVHVHQGKTYTSQRLRTPIISSVGRHNSTRFDEGRC